MNTTKSREHTMVCQVCGECRPADFMETLTEDVSERFGLEGLVYFIVDYCFERRICEETAKARAAAFAGGDDAAARTSTNPRCPMKPRPDT